MDDAAKTLAAALIAARRTQRAVPAAEADRLAAAAGQDGAAAVQAATVEAFGPAGAWKTTPAVAGGVFSPILVGTVRPTGTSFGTAEFFACAAELEIAFRFDAPPPAPDAPDFDAALRRAVTAVPVIELLDGRTEDFSARPPLTKLADLLVNGALVVGSPDGAEVDMGRPAVRLTIGGKVVLDGATDVPGGDAFATLALFVKNVGGFCGGLQQGHVVTTGAIGGMHWVAPGETVEGHIAGLGSVSCSFG